jgi:hypothetical protein
METPVPSYLTFCAELREILKEHHLLVSKKIIGQVLGLISDNHVYALLNGPHNLSGEVLFTIFLLLGYSPEELKQKLKDCKKFLEAMQKDEELKAKMRKTRRRKG